MNVIEQLKEFVAEFVAERNWEEEHNPKNLAMSIAIEAAELMEHFQWKSISEGSQMIQNDKFIAEVTDELADVLIYVLSFANTCDIDLENAIREKMAINVKRFPEEHTLD